MMVELLILPSVVSDTDTEIGFAVQLGLGLPLVECTYSSKGFLHKFTDKLILVFVKEA